MQYDSLEIIVQDSETGIIYDISNITKSISTSKPMDSSAGKCSFSIDTNVKKLSFMRFPFLRRLTVSRMAPPDPGSPLRISHEIRMMSFCSPFLQIVRISLPRPAVPRMKAGKRGLITVCLCAILPSDRSCGRGGITTAGEYPGHRSEKRNERKCSL